MRTELRNAELAGPPVDWMAEFADEESTERLLPLFPSDDRPTVREERLIPVPEPEPQLSWNPPPRRPKLPQADLSMSPFVLVGGAMIAVFAALIATAVLWNRTAQMVDKETLLAQAPGSSTSEPSAPLPEAALIPPPVAPVPTPPKLAGASASSKNQVAAKAPSKTVSSKSQPRAASSVPPLIQGVRDRQRLASPDTGVTTDTASPPPPPSTPTPIPTPTPTLLATTPPPATLGTASSAAALGTPPAAKPAAETAAAPSSARPAPAPDERAVHTAAIQSVLDRYRLAFNTLSVDGLATVWRTVDTRALARAFDQLEKQTVEFNACRIDITGELAEALCNGRTSYVPKIGARTPRTDSRQWSFRLVRVRGGWVIDRVESR